MDVARCTSNKHAKVWQRTGYTHAATRGTSAHAYVRPMLPGMEEDVPIGLGRRGQQTRDALRQGELANPKPITPVALHDAPVELGLRGQQMRDALRQLGLVYGLTP